MTRAQDLGFSDIPLELRGASFLATSWKQQR